MDVRAKARVQQIQSMVEFDEIEDRCLNLVPRLPDIVVRLVALASNRELGCRHSLLLVKNLFVEIDAELRGSELHCLLLQLVGS